MLNAVIYAQILFRCDSSNMILITGAAGFIGSNYAHLAALNNEEIAICDWFAEGKKWKNLQGLNIGDIIAPENLMSWLRYHKTSLIVHMGAISTTTEVNVDYLIQQNFEFSKQLWMWCTESQIRFIYASSAATYGNGDQGFVDDNSIDYLQKLRPLNAYGWSKNIFDMWAITQVAKENHPPQWAGLKFFNVYGPRETHKGLQRSVAYQLYEQMKHGGGVIKLFKSYNSAYSDGGQLRDFIYIDDCCNVIDWLRKNPNISGIFNVGTGKARSFLELAKSVAAAMGEEPKIEFIEKPEQIRKHYQYFTQADTSFLRKKGFDSTFTSLEKGVEAYIDFLKKNPDF